MFRYYKYISKATIIVQPAVAAILSISRLKQSEFSLQIMVHLEEIVRNVIQVVIEQSVMGE